MEPITILFNLLSLGLTIGGMAGQAKTSQKITDQQLQAEKLRANRERRQSIRQAQLQRAQMAVAAQAYGAQGSSAIGGGMASLGSQVGESMGYATQMSGISQNLTRLDAEASKYAAMTKIGSSIYGSSLGGGFDTTKDILKQFSGSK